ncbi:YceI family protein [Sphingobium sp. AN641]|uniref:YceI family protein n=1 Tax=Sphingobium sp. AN641 TaxID=3133443 RepID=UPI0030C12DC1
MQRYSRIAMALHWIIAFAIAFQISVGWALEDLGARGFALYQLHKTVGITILLLTLVRIAVRFTKPRPAPTEGGWEGALAKAVHLGLYLFMLGAPLTGWALVSTAKVKVPTLLFGIIPLPHLPLPAAAHELTEGGHGLLAWFGILLFLLHVAGALRHQLLLRDGLVWRMIPLRSTALLWLLALLVPAGLLLGKAIVPAAGPAPRATAAEPLPDNAASADNAAALTESENAALPANAVDASEEAVAQDSIAPPPAWTLQPGGRIGFAVGNGSDTIKGSFGKWTAAMVMDPERPETADIRVSIDMASASVGDAYQDGMLPGEEFFAVAAHPTATFTAKGAERTGANGYRATGTLDLKGITRPQAIRFTLTGTGESRKVAGSATIARAPFGVGNGASSEGLDAKVAVDFAFTARKDQR